MTEAKSVVEYKCPNCGGAISFSGPEQKLTCPYCDSSFSVDDVISYNDSRLDSEQEMFSWEEWETKEFSQEDAEELVVFTCPACGGELLTEAHTAATFCPFCQNPAVLPQRLSGSVKPDGVIPFKKTKKDAQEAFLALCRKKKLIPKLFVEQQRIEKITGVYVPFWLYDCSGSESARYHATRIHTWSDHNYNYTRTDRYLLIRRGEADFLGIPMDGSSKLADDIMESIEPFDYGDITGFNMAYLSGYLADKYDVEAKCGEDRIRQRVSATIDAALSASTVGYSTAVQTSRQVSVQHSRARYVLLPVWLLTTKYKDKIYTYAMNGQTGKMTGSFPISARRCFSWFAGVCGGTAAVAFLVQMLAFFL